MSIIRKQLAAALELAGSGGAGGELVDLLFRAQLTDSFTSKADSSTPVDPSAGLTDSSLYVTKYKYYQLSYDAGKTVSTSGTLATMSAAPAFTVKAGDVVVSGGIVRKITSLTSQTSYTLEAAFPADLTNADCVVSQAVHTVDLNAFDQDGAGNSVGSVITDDLTEILVGYEDSGVDEDAVPDLGVTPHIAYSASISGTEWSEAYTREQYLTNDAQAVAFSNYDNKLYLRFFANKTTGSGIVNLLSFKVWWHKIAAEQSGEEYFSAFSRPGAGINVNCTHSVANGKSRFTFAEGYGRGLNPTDPAGSAIKVLANGQQFPRYIDGTKVDLSQGYFKEIDNVTIEADQDYSSSSIEFQFNVPRLVIDTRTQNTERISDLENFAQEGFQDFVIQDYIDVPYTTIVNRAQIPNLANDLMPRMGINRIMIQDIAIAPTELGPNGELIKKAVNDNLDQIRFVGEGLRLYNNDNGPRVAGGRAGDYCEITFYGTGLNLLSWLGNASTYDIRISVDGGSFGSNLYAGYGQAIGSRYYGPNQILPLVSGLSLGIHTVIIKGYNTPAFNCFGFEILNEDAALKIPSGSAFIDRKKVTHNSFESMSYNSGFEAGTLGTKGGHVLTYMKSDGSIGKSLTPTELVPAYFSSANHSNEEVLREFNLREFGCGRSDDFSTLESTIDDRAFTLNDGTTTLVGNNVASYTDSLAIEGIYPQAADGPYFIFTFVGTGLDTYLNRDTALTTTFQIYVDGTEITSGATAGSTLFPIASPGAGIAKICSGLPYGTHSVKILRRSAGIGPQFTKFIVYGPKEPDLPVGAVKLGSYFIMADYDNSPITSGASDGKIQFATGTLAKMNMREFIYFGTIPNVIMNVSYASGWYVDKSANEDFFEYSFVGTGCLIRLGGTSGGTGIFNLYVDGSLYSGATNIFNVTNNGGGSYTSESVLSGNNTLEITGLTFGKHTIKVSKTGGTSTMYLGGVDIITPVHSGKSYIPVNHQTNLPVGSQAILDLRKLTAIKDEVPLSKGIVKAIGIQNSPTTTVVARTPMPDMHATIDVSKDGSIDVDIYCTFNKTVQATATYVYVYVDGVYAHHDSFREYNTPVGQQYHLSGKVNIPVSKGVHFVQVYWYIGGGTLTATSTNRWMTVQEV